MHTRLVTITEADNIDNGVAFLREQVVPTLKDQKGYRGLTASADRDAGLLEVVTFWDSAADRQASESVAGKLRREALRLVGGAMNVETFDDLLTDFTEPPLIGSAQMVTRVRMDPARIDEHLAAFTNEILPRIKATPGYRSLCRMIDRETGHGVMCSEWKDEPSMEAWAADAWAIRQEAIARGVTFGYVTYQEILFADLAEEMLSSH